MRAVMVVVVDELRQNSPQAGSYLDAAGLTMSDYFHDVSVGASDFRR